MYSWPDDSDGDVFRSLQQQGFDFTKKYIIDFNIDFEKEANPQAIGALRQLKPDAEIVDNTHDEPPYIQLKINSILDYDLVIRMQSQLSAAMRPFSGWCESWGILH